MRIPLSREIAEAALRENCDCDTLHTRPPLFGKLDVAGMGFQITSPFLPCRRDPFLKIEGTLTPSGGGTCAKLRLTLPGRIWGLSLAALLLWVAALCVSLYDYHQAYNGWSETSIIEEPSPYGQ